jgi:hypothetical protein
VAVVAWETGCALLDGCSRFTLSASLGADAFSATAAELCETVFATGCVTIRFVFGANSSGGTGRLDAPLFACSVGVRLVAKLSTAEAEPFVFEIADVAAPRSERVPAATDVDDCEPSAPTDPALGISGTPERVPAQSFLIDATCASPSIRKPAGTGTAVDRARLDVRRPVGSAEDAAAPVEDSAALAGIAWISVASSRTLPAVTFAAERVTGSMEFHAATAPLLPGSTSD